MIAEFKKSLSNFAEKAKFLALGLRNASFSSIKLRETSLSDRECRLFVQYIVKNAGLQSIELSYVQMTSKGWSLFVEAMQTNQSVTSLILMFTWSGLDWNGLDEKNRKALAEMLKANRTLQNLSLTEANNAPWGKELADVLKVNQSLKTLELCSSYENLLNKIDDEAIIELAEALEVNQTLNSLRIQENRVTDKGMIAIAKMLKLNTHLTSLALIQGNIGYHRIGAEGIIALAEALTMNTTLKYLNLVEQIGLVTEFETDSYKGMGTQVATSLGQALSLNQGLTELNFSDTLINDEEAKHLAQGIKENKMLRILRLTCNDIGYAGADAFLTMLESNKIIELIDLRSFYSSGDHEWWLHEKFKSCKRMKVGPI